jgi:trehalose 6-phosphate phosphatase
MPANAGCRRFRSSREFLAVACGYDPAMTATGRHRPGLTIRQALERSAAAGRCGFYFDFDGVLAPVRLDPESVMPTPGVLDQLALLEARVDKIGVISARPVEFLLSRFGGLPSVSLFGLYGLESAIDGAISVDPSAESWMPVIRSVISDAKQQLPPGVYVEDKRISVSLHYREHTEHQAEVRRWAAAVAAERGLSEQQGRMVTELKPPVRIDKGTVLSAEVADLRSGWYFGDDLSDAEGFAALRDRHRQDAEFFEVCVAVRNPETGQDLERQADFTLADPGEMPELLAVAVAAFAS